MATSGSIDFNQSLTEIIKDALILVGGVEDDETPAAEQTEHAKRALNRMVKRWMREGMKVWTLTEGELDLARGQNSYTLGVGGDYAINRPLEVMNVRRYVDSVETPINPMSRQDYMNQVSKDDEGKPVSYYYDKQLTKGVLYLWPTPDDSTDQIKFTYQTPIEDFDALTDNPHFPVEWLDAIVWGLAESVSPLYETDLNQRQWIGLKAREYLMQAIDYDDEFTSLYIQPEGVTY